MYFLFKNHKVDYSITGDGHYLVLLHGWGVDKSTFNNLVEGLKLYYTVLTLDFIGFGESDEPQYPFTLNDYVAMVKALLDHLHIENPIMFGHSFGGRVAIKYALNNEVRILILMDSAGIRHLPLSKKYKILKYKFLKNLYKLISLNKLEKLRAKTGSSDYQKCSPMMKKTLSNVVKVNLKKDIKKLNCKTLILWGYYDKVTPYSDAVYFHQKIANSRLITFYNSGHFPYIDEEKKTLSAIISGGLNNGYYL